MRIKQRFDTKKAIEAILYIAEHNPDTYDLMKILYFADKEHLAKYGRFICGGSYIAMRLGPVPSGVYDIIKYARGDGIFLISEPIADAFEVRGYNIIPLRVANVELLSESDLECLGEAIRQYGHLSLGELKALSHDAAYQEADVNDVIPIEAIVKTLPDSELLLDYLQNA